LRLLSGCCSETEVSEQLYLKTPFCKVKRLSAFLHRVGKAAVHQRDAAILQEGVFVYADWTYFNNLGGC
jgi:hypothetical protein